MCITRTPVRKSRPPTRRSTQSHVRSSTTATSKTERASCESIRARAQATVEYGNRLERIRGHRAQGRRPPPDASTGTRAFNAPAAFSPNPQVTGSVIGNRHASRHSFCNLPHQTSQNVAGRKEWVGTSNQTPLETSKVSALAGKALYNTRPSSRHISFLEKSWVTGDSTSTTPTQTLPRRTSVQQINQPRTAHRAGYRGTRNHHQAIRTRWLETTPVRRPRVGQRAIPLSTPTLMTIHVP